MTKKVECKYCGKEYSSKGISTHIMRTHEKNSNWDNQKEKSFGDKIKNGIAKKHPRGKPSPFKGRKHSKEFFAKVEHHNDIIFVENSTYPRHRLKARLIRDNLIEYKCVICCNEGLWNSKPITLQIDHINGINNDNTIDNLRFLCPNCHSQTDNYAGKNNRRSEVLR